MDQTSNYQAPEVVTAGSVGDLTLTMSSGTYGGNGQGGNGQGSGQYA